MPETEVSILGLSATIIKDGNCDVAVQEALKEAGKMDGVKTKFISMADKRVDMCKDCQHCMKHASPCNVDDDANRILEEMTRADGIIFGTPTWCRTVAPPLLHLFSRLRTTAFFTQALRNKITGLITVGFLGHGLDYTLQTMDEFTYGHGMIRAARATVISSSIIFGGRPDYLEHGVLDDKRGMRYVKIVGQRVVELSKMIKYATEAGVAPPTKFNIATGGSM